MLPIRSFTLATWLHATLKGLVPADDMVAAVRAAGGDDTVTGVVVPDPARPLPLLRLPAALRPARPEAVSLALPVPGDPLGLAGPARFNESALDAGEAVVVHLASGHAYGLVPTVQGWESYDVAIPHLPSLPDAQREYRIALAETRPEDFVARPSRGRPAQPNATPPTLPPGGDSRRSAALEGPWHLLAALVDASSMVDDRAWSRLRHLHAAARRTVAAVASDSLGVR